MSDDALRDLVENAPCGLVAATPQGTIVHANATLLAWIGATPDDVVGARTFPELLTVPGRVFWETHFAPLLRMQGFVYEVAVDLARAAGEPIPVLVNANEDRDDAGAVRAVRIAVFRAADRRKYERELLLSRQMAEQALKAKADFLAFFAHEVKNPLGAVQLAADAVRRAGVPPAGERPLAALDRALGKVLGVLENMLDFSKIEAGKAALDVHRLDVRELVHGAAQALEPLAERKGLPIRVEVADDVPAHVTGDGVKIGQVLTNLIGNAVKFTERGAVTVRTTLAARTGGDVALDFVVADTGIGIPASRLPHVFDEYAQAGPDISARYGGTGLGLAICRRILELHGSRMTVESELGVGTTFRFRLTLPLAPDDAPRPGDVS